MSALTPNTPLASQQIEQLQAPPPGSKRAVAAGPAGNGIPLMVRPRHRVLRMAPPIDDGFRPFRVF